MEVLGLQPAFGIYSPCSQPLRIPAPPFYNSPNHGWSKHMIPALMHLPPLPSRQIFCPQSSLRSPRGESRSTGSQNLIRPQCLCQSLELTFCFLDLGRSFLCAVLPTCGFSPSPGCSSRIARVLFLKGSSDHLFPCQNFKSFPICI